MRLRSLWIVPAIALLIAAQSSPQRASGFPFQTVRTGTFAPTAAQNLSVRVLVWNIDRGTERDAILQAMRDRRPDLCLLQEVDYHSKRSALRDEAEDFARALTMNYAFGIAFQELNQSQREQPAYQGQATLSRLPMEASRLISFVTESNFWKPEPYLPSWFPQRRLGGRIALVSNVIFGGSRLVVYNLHLESREPGSIRFKQLEETLGDTDRLPKDTPILLAGDLNTKFAHREYVDLLRSRGFSDCFTRRERTHRIYGALDWILVRGPLECAAAEVHRDAAGSDHFPLTVTLTHAAAQAKSSF